MADNTERLIFSLEVNQNKALQDAAKLEKKLLDLREERKRLNKEVKAGNDVDGKYAAQLARTNVEIQKTSKSLRVARKEVQAGSKNYAEQANRLSVLTDRWKKFQVGIDGTEKEYNDLGRSIRNLNEDLKAQDASLGNFQRNVGDYKNAIVDALDSTGVGIGNITAALSNPVLLAGAIVSGVIEAGKELAQFVDVLGKQREEVQKFTGATGEALDTLTAQIRATSSTFGQDFNETLVSANVLAREFGITLNEAADLQQKAFASGADLTGQLTDSIQEYSTQFREVGITADEFLGIISTNVTEGIYSDKGIDAIKEAGLRLREMPKAAQDALQGIGLSSTEISNALASGSRSTFDVIQEISTRLGELPPQSREVGSAIADIFGGPGEDAGLRFLTTIKDIEGGITGISEGLEGAAARQLRLVEANQRLSKTWNELLGGSSEFFQEVKVGAIEFLANFIEQGVRGLENMINGFIELYNNSILFRGIIQTIGAGFRTVIDVVQGFINLSLEGFSSIGDVIRAVLTGNFKDLPNIIRESASGFGSAVREVGADLAENYVEGFNNTFKPKLLESFKFGGDASLQDASAESGKILGGAFAKGYGEIVQAQIQAITAKATAALEIQLAENDRLKELRDNTEGFQAESTQSETDEAKARKVRADEAIQQDKARIQSAASLASAVKQFAGERAEASKAASVIEKLAAATEIGLNLQREISGYWTNTGIIPGVGPGLATGLSIAAGVRTAISLASLAGLAEGGYTPGTGIPDPNLPGQRITGYVHANEYVVPSSVLNTAQGASYVRGLEAMRMGLPGYASGGFTGTQLATSSAISESQMLNVMQTAFRNMPQQYVAVSEINRGQQAVRVVQSRATT